jgi:hypothetical protein
MAERGMPLGTLAAILGHSSLRMVMRYVHPTQDHMDSETVRIDGLLTAEKAAMNLADGDGYRRLQSWPGPTLDKEDTQPERIFNDLTQRPAKIEKPH